ncbi:MAG: hypothetical protein GY913_32210 [Proteobacteria bacterium]|nr:hypothetical protein [Pseudomonadota bacterium]MCP4921586.1 hypothetical protein [Pseudomonadota bacterium]
MLTDTTRRGMSFLVLFVALVLGVSLTTEAAGLKYVQNLVWPSDVYAFQTAVDGPVDVVIFGSSRASFGISPTRLDLCLEDQLERETRTVSLARVYSTGLTWNKLARYVLVDDKVPDVLVIGVTPEAFNDHNHKNDMIYAHEGEIADVPAMLAASSSYEDVLGSLAPLARGPEALALILSGRFDNEARLRWLMLHERGGQFCSGDPACGDQNQAFEDLQDYRWAKWAVQREELLSVERFSDFEAGEGLHHAELMELLDWADENEVQVMLVNMPLHPAFFQQVPPETYMEYSDYLWSLSREHGLPTFDGNLTDWRDDKEHWLDPDHLGRTGAMRFSDELCAAVAPELRK